MADPEQIRQRIQSPAPFSTWLGVVLLLLVFGAIAIAIIGPAPRGDTYEQQRAQDRAKKLKDLRDEDAKALTTYAWVDKNKGTLRVPIERAMELTVSELANKKPAAAGPIAAPASFGGTGWGNCCVARAITFAAIKRHTETNFGGRSAFGSARSASRGCESAASSTFHAARWVRVAGCAGEIFRCRTGRITFSRCIHDAARKSVASPRHNGGANSVADPGTTMKMSILPNE